MIGWTGHMTSLDSLTVLVDCDIYKWVSLIDKWCYAFSAAKLLVASSLHCVNCRLNLNPCFFTYCTCHMTISTSCVWLKVKCTQKGWFNPSWLLQSTAISRTNSSLKKCANSKHVLPSSRLAPCVDICAYNQMSWQ